MPASRRLAAALLLLAAPCTLRAQHAPDHAGHVMPAAAAPPASRPTLPGQDAFGAIAEVVRLLDADSTTDWSRVDVERLRRHLIDMSDVTLRAVVAQRPIAGGAVLDVTGAGRTMAAIRRMTTAHAPELAASGLVATSAPIPGGARLTVRARDTADTRLVARVRALGLVGLLTLGEHHAAHHLAIARGDAMAGHAGH